MKSARPGAFEVVAALLGVVTLAAIVAVVLALAYPRAAESLGADLVSGRPWMADALNGASLAADNLAKRAEAGWDHRFVRPAQRVFGSHDATAEIPVTDEFPAEECERCHPGFRERPLFSVVFSPHAVHAENDVPCGRCHAATGPNRDRVPAMDGCGDCHSQTSTGRGCDTCHPPGSLFHGAALAGDREIGLRCETCHSEQRLVAGARSRGVSRFERSAESCSGCHDEKYCERCHPASHPAGYARGHVADFRARTARHSECYECHVSGWCVMRCHTR